ncbi:MAG: hypothetical protein IKF72_03390 [Kiritimatiellae bacterium]|nr:hypothetical protein [Kiritimatiellia bacterium]
MGLFDRMKTSAAGIGAAVSRGVGQVTGKATVEAKEAAKITAVKADIAALQADIDAGYLQIGKAYVDACIAGTNVPDIGVGGTLKLMEPKLEKKIALEKELIELEKALADSQLMQERALVQAEVDDVKAKLDKAKAMGAITEADYNAKLAQANKKLEHFEDIRMLKKQKELGLLTSAELDAKVKALLA